MFPGLCSGSMSRRLRKSPSSLSFLKRKDSLGILGLCNVR
jgi:hypothetical protein